MKNIFLTFLTAFVLVTAASCTTFRVSGVEFSPQPVVENVVGDFDLVVRVHQFFGVSNGMHLANITADAMDPAVVQAVQDEIDRQGGSRAINVRITYRASFFDLLLNHLTVRVWAPASVYVTGTIIQ